MKKQEYATPSEHDSKLIFPSGVPLKALWQENLNLRSQATTINVGQADLASLQSAGRSELLRAAVQYSSQYLDCAIEDPASDQPIIMAGHQPELFHPGVWFKNFVLSNLHQRFSATSVNLIVDNDLCTSRNLRVPAGREIPERLDDLSLDGHLTNRPFEGSVINDSELFRSAGVRIEAAIQPLIANPIIAQLWPEVLHADERLSVNGPVCFGQAIAAGRHRLEANFGLKTLEVPVSWLARTKSFANFVWQILCGARRFANLHNQSLLEYRRLYDLRSKTHPFPELEQREDWIETPFWVFHDGASSRKALFVRPRAGKLELSDLDGWSVSGVNGAGDLQAQNQEGRLPIRPRALTTTMFSRMFLSDLFIHGTGGGKYDQMTDWLSQQFWQVRLPGFCVVSATYKLFPSYPGVTPEQIAQQKQQLRELEMNPDRFLASVDDQIDVPADVRTAADLKRSWICGQQTGSGKERHAALAECNRILRQWTEPLKKRLVAKLDVDVRRLEQEQRFGSREFSFCLHPIERIEQLLQC